jgi:hypothetical protein
MRVLAILLSAFLFASCDYTPSGSRGQAFAPLLLEPSAAFAVSVSPQIIPLTFAPLGCPLFGRPITTSFDLVIAPFGSGTFFMDNVAFRLIDGSSHGTSPIVIDRGVLGSTFGSTAVVGRRAFPFTPQFGCVSFVPLFLDVDVRMLDKFGTPQTVRATARF